MNTTWCRLFVLVLLGGSLALTGCGSGSDGAPGAQGPPGPGGGSVIDASTAPDAVLEGMEVEAEVTQVVVASPPMVYFTVTSEDGIPIAGIGALWQENSRFVRFTCAKLVPGATSDDPDAWVSYTRDASSNDPDYDTGSSLVDNGDGSYVFTFETDITTVPGVPYEPTLTHRVGGQIGGASALEPMNLWYDWVPAGGPLPNERYIVDVASCNECHDELAFHGSRFLVQYCVTCHNQDLAGGEGTFAFLIHRLHSGGSFAVLDGGTDFDHVTYPQDLANCRKCHNGDDAATPQGDNWKENPNVIACDGCHDNFSTGSHSGGPLPLPTSCNGCHPPDFIEEKHTTEFLTVNNPNLLENQRSITYDLIDATVMPNDDVVINFRVVSDGVEELDVTNLPVDILVGNRYPSFLLAFALPQGGIAEPADFTNFGRLPIEVDWDALAPIDAGSTLGTITFAGGVNTATITGAAGQFPGGATMRTVGIQGYFRQDLNGDGAEDEDLHTASAVVTVTGDTPRRRIVDNDKCSNCHDLLGLHGDNRVYEIAICQMCHVPNFSSSGRTITALDPIDPDLLDDFANAHDLDPNIDPNDPLTYPEAAQGLKHLIHGIHSAGFREFKFEHVRGDRQGYYDWSEVTFPAENGTRNCFLCHIDVPFTGRGRPRDFNFELPFPEGILPYTVRTTGVNDGMDASPLAAWIAFQILPNSSDWINSDIGGTCFGCHANPAAVAHMVQNGAFLSRGANVTTAMGQFVNRFALPPAESCAVCHGRGRLADIQVVHLEHH